MLSHSFLPPPRISHHCPPCFLPLTLSLCLAIGDWWDDIIQDDSSRCMFDMELEDDTMNKGDEFPELLDKLMVLSFEHLQSCQNVGRLDEAAWHQIGAFINVFEILFESFENLILNTYKSKCSQFLMFYACSLDPGTCGVKFVDKLLDISLSSNKPRVTRMSTVGYLASYLSRGKFLPTSFVASMLKRYKENCFGSDSNFTLL